MHKQRQKMLIIRLLVFALFVFQQSPTAAQAQQTHQAIPESVVHLTLLHFNDVYEILPVSGGKLGGLARVATLQKELITQNPNTFTFFGGDLYKPSAIGAATLDGTPIDGEHMVAVMNTVGINYMVFGDHEFHVSSEDEFRQRMSETQFPILSANLFEANGEPFPGVTEHAILVATNQSGQEVKIGVFGVTKEIRKPVVAHRHVDLFEATAQQIRLLRDRVDILIALTHQLIRDDVELAKRFPEIDIILGGDDHEHMAVETGQDLATIYKTDSNVRSVYILEIRYNTATNDYEIEPRLLSITDAFADDPASQKVVDHWVQVGFDAFRKQGMNPDEVVVQTPIDLDGFMSSVRNRPTELTNIIATALLKAAPGAELAFMESGYIRLDDLIPAGSTVTQYDILRIIPIDLQVISVQMPGSLVKKLLDGGQEHVGSGHYLLMANVEADDTDTNWLIDNKPLNPNSFYLVAMTDQFFKNYNLQDSNAQVIQQHHSIRKAIAQQLKASR